MSLRAALAMMGACITVTPASAQVMRAFSATRPSAGERMLRATLEFGAGRVVVQPGTAGELYRAALRYVSERSAPVHEYDRRTGILRLGLEAVGGGGVRVTSRAHLSQTARFELAPDIPLSLLANLGAAEASMDLGGTTLNDLTVRTGATRGTLTFSRPTVGRCQQATFTLGASNLEVRRLAAAGCSLVRVEGGVGGITLSFDGAWRRDASVEVELSMGTMTLRVPRDVALRITAARFLTSLDAAGLTRNGNVWSSEGFETAAHKLSVELKTSMAGVKIVWIDDH